MRKRFIDSLLNFILRRVAGGMRWEEEGELEKELEKLRQRVTDLEKELEKLEKELEKKEVEIEIYRDQVERLEKYRQKLEKFYRGGEKLRSYEGEELRVAPVEEHEQVLRWQMFGTWLKKYHPENFAKFERDFSEIPTMPNVEEKEGFIPVLCYGFGDDEVDIPLTVRLVWEYLSFNLQSVDPDIEVTAFEWEQKFSQLNPEHPLKTWENISLPATDGIKRPVKFHWVLLNMQGWKNISVAEAELLAVHERLAAHEALEFISVVQPLYTLNLIYGNSEIILGGLRLGDQTRALRITRSIQRRGVKLSIESIPTWEEIIGGTIPTIKI